MNIKKLNEELDSILEDEYENIKNVLDAYANSENAFQDGFITFEDLRQFDADHWLADWSNDAIRDAALEMGYEVDGDKILDPSI